MERNQLSENSQTVDVVYLLDASSVLIYLKKRLERKFISLVIITDQRSMTICFLHFKIT